MVYADYCPACKVGVVIEGRQGEQGDAEAAEAAETEEDK